MQKLDEARDRLADRLLVAPAQMRTEPEMTLGDVPVAVLAEFAEDFGQVIGDYAEVVCVRGV